MQCGRPVASLHRRRHPRQGPHTLRKLSNSAAGVVNMSLSMETSDSSKQNVNCVRATSSASTIGSPLPEGTAIKDNPVLPRFEVTIKTRWMTCQNHGCHWYYKRRSPAELAAMRYPHSGPYPHICPFK